MGARLTLKMSSDDDSPKDRQVKLYTPMHSIGPSELVLMSIIYLYYNACMYGGGLKEMPCFRTHIKLVRSNFPLAVKFFLITNS